MVDAGLVDAALEGPEFVGAAVAWYGHRFASHLHEDGFKVAISRPHVDMTEASVPGPAEMDVAFFLRKVSCGR